MIQAKELRIGNVIEANTPPMIVQAINKDSVELYMPGSEADNFEEDLEKCNGIPLTPEILEKCGFQKANNDRWLIEMDGPHRHIEVIWYGLAKNIYVNLWEAPELSSGEPIFYSIGGVKYLHQLQNLYWCLCGKELLINLH